MARALILPLLAFVFGWQSGAAQPVQLVDSEDTAALSSAASASSNFCSIPLKGTLVSGQDALTALISAVGGDNLVLKILSGTPQSQLAQKAQNVLAGATLVSKAAGVIVAIIMVIIWFFCCWTCCPCCRCCRCGAKERETSKYVKWIVAFLLVGLAAGIIVSIFVALRGFNATSNGVNIMSCSMASLVNTTLAGGGNFSGMIPTLSTINTLVGQLNTGSPFLTQLTPILTQTQPVTDAVAVLAEVLRMLQATTANNANVYPQTTTNKASKHTCTFCQQLSPKIPPVLADLNTGVAAALAAVQKQVSTQLSSASRQNQINALQPTLTALQSAKVSVRSAGAFFIDQKSFGQISYYMGTAVLGAVVGICVAGIVLVVFGLIATACFTFCEKRKLEEDKQVPNAHVYRLACCTWCCSWGYAVIVFLIAGVMTIVAVPVSGMCLILANLNSDTLNTIGPAIGLDPTAGNTSTMAIGLVNSCLSPSSTNTNILKILTVNGTSVYDTMVTGVQAPITNSFSGLDASPQMNLASDPDVQGLVSILQNYLATAMTTPDNTFSSDTDFGGQKMNQNDPSGIFAAAQQTSLQCSDQTTGADFGSVTTLGVTSFINQLNTKFGNGVPTSTLCGVGVQGCSFSLTSSQLSACQGAQLYVAEKADLLSSTNTQWRCDIYLDQNSQPCDPVNMQQVSGVWTNDCLLPDGTPSGRFTVQPKQCTASQFATYMQNFATRINKAVSRVDTAASQTQTTISNDLRNLVNQYLINPLLSVANGASCSFLGVQYYQFVNGLCYQTAWGFSQIATSYIVCAALTTVLIALMYGIWRRAIDNSNAAAAAAGGQAKADSGAAAAGAQFTVPDASPENKRE